jgi:Respiratory-chain NADH dehydrogenase, 49 Kd subunit
MRAAFDSDLTRRSLTREDTDCGQSPGYPTEPQPDGLCSWSGGGAAVLTRRETRQPFHVRLRLAGQSVWCRLLRGILGHGHSRREPITPTAAVEGWRGEIFHWIHTAPGNRLARCKVRDPSLQNWPALSEAILGNIIPDFPVVNKSFNLSYSGTDR